MASKWLSSIKSPSGRIARWALQLQQYRFEFWYRTELYLVADALSRQPVPETLRRAKKSVSNKECNWIRDMREKIRTQLHKFSCVKFKLNQTREKCWHKSQKCHRQQCAQTSSDQCQDRSMGTWCFWWCHYVQRQRKLFRRHLENA